MGSEADALTALQAAEVDRRLRFSDPFKHARLSAFLDGFSLHAGVRLHGNARAGLERLCRSALRPPTAVEGRGWAARLPDEVASGAPPPAPSHGRRGRRHGARGWVPWAFHVATARRCQRPFARTAEAIYALSPRVLAPLFTAAGSRNS